MMQSRSTTSLQQICQAGRPILLRQPKRIPPTTGDGWTTITFQELSKTRTGHRSNTMMAFFGATHWHPILSVRWRKIYTISALKEGIEVVLTSSGSARFVNGDMPPQTLPFSIITLLLLLLKQLPRLWKEAIAQFFPLTLIFISTVYLLSKWRRGIPMSGSRTPLLAFTSRI